MILAILQARVGSTRLSGKVLKEILGKPMIERQIERLHRANRIDRLMVATSVDSQDDAVAELCWRNDVDCYRGNLEDVLDRFYQAARCYRPTDVVRLTGDCPLADPYIIDQVIQFHVTGGYDYASNTLEPSFPDGLDVEVLRFSVLEQAWLEARLPSEREHVTPFLYNRPDRFMVGSFSGSVNLSKLRWTVDEPQDLEFVRRVYEALYPTKSDFRMHDVLELLARQPELAQINAIFKRNEGHQKSLVEDARYLKKNLKGG